MIYAAVMTTKYTSNQKTVVSLFGFLIILKVTDRDL
jgi:hypothetical protein